MAVYNITINQGETYDLTASIVDGGGAPLNISGYALRGKIKSSYGSTGILADLQPEIINATGGVISFSLDAIETASLPITIGVYDIERYVSGQNPETTVYRVLEGKVTITPEVTK